ncbi:MAG: QueT transporter family protein [Oscillospiraceae bacterium]|nr:QueT transporter family protein [Oscillospiraceae bacterium]
MNNNDNSNIDGNIDGNIDNNSNSKGSSESKISGMFNWYGAYMGRGRFGRARFITHAALIAAVYAALTIWLAPISFGQQQLRVAEALAILPAFTPAAIPGLFIGCALANTVSFMGIPDLIFGSFATLISAQLTYMIAQRVKGRGAVLQAVLLPMPAVLINTVVIGAMLSIMLSIPLWAAALGVMAGQTLSCYGLGVPLMFLMRGFKYYAHPHKRRGDGSFDTNK